MNQQHAYTAGPWYLSTKRPLASKHSDDINRFEYYVYAKKGNIATIPMDLVLHANLDAEANARLIAAAPDLLEALEFLLEQTVNMDLKHGIGLSDVGKEARGKALAAVSKAIYQLPYSSPLKRPSRFHRKVDLGPLEEPSNT